MVDGSIGVGGIPVVGILAIVLLVVATLSFNCRMFPHGDAVSSSRKE